MTGPDRATAGLTVGLTVGLATVLIPPGPVRDRYRAEFAAELADLTGSRRLARSGSIVAGAPAAAMSSTCRAGCALR